jgi:hypothetical protein
MRSKYKLEYFHHFYWRFFKKEILGNTSIGFKKITKHYKQTIDALLIAKREQSILQPLNETLKSELAEKVSLKRRPQKWKKVTSKKTSKKFQALTKKQKKKIKKSKIYKLLYPNTERFKWSIPINRNIKFVEYMVGKNFISSDGYSWVSINPESSQYINKTVGFVNFKTRVLSPIKLVEKGKIKLSLKQKETYKIKTLKVKRKK